MPEVRAGRRNGSSIGAISFSVRRIFNDAKNYMSTLICTVHTSFTAAAGHRDSGTACRWRCGIFNPAASRTRRHKVRDPQRDRHRCRSAAVWAEAWVLLRPVEVSVTANAAGRRAGSRNLMNRPYAREMGTPVPSRLRTAKKPHPRGLAHFVRICRAYSGRGGALLVDWFDAQ